MIQEKPMAYRTLTRREFSRTSMVSLLSVLGSASAYKGAAQTNINSSSRRSVIRQRLPDNPERQIMLVEVVFPPGVGSPPHVHPNGVMAFVVSGSIASKVGDEPERVFHAGEAWWEPPGAVHRVSRNTSSSEDARLLAIYVAPPNASESDLIKPL
jgi:quercetin dioxygenase-like cupin family protein